MSEIAPKKVELQNGTWLAGELPDTLEDWQTQRAEEIYVGISHVDASGPDAVTISIDTIEVDVFLNVPLAPLLYGAAELVRVRDENADDADWDEFRGFVSRLKAIVDELQRIASAKEVGR